MRHYAHHIGDYRAHTAHLSFVEDAAYRRLLELYYMHEKPLAADPADVQRLVGARSRDEKTAVLVILHEFFTKQDDGWHQTRADEEIAGYQSRVGIARENGRKSGGRPKPADNPSGNQVGYPSVPTGVTNQEPVTSNQEPLEEASSSVAAPAADNLAIPAELDARHDAAALMAWNTAAVANGWPEAQFLNSTRRIFLRQRLGECGGIEGFRAALGRAAGSDWLKGQRWFDLDWMLKPENFTRLMEGRYAERHRSTNTALEALAEFGRTGPG